MKHLIKLALLLLAILLPATATAFDIRVGKLYYNITSSNTVEVTYKDNNYSSYNGAVYIPSQVTYNSVNYSVTAIGDSAFYQCSIDSVEIPETVTRIGTAAFKNCSNLSRVTCNPIVPPVMENSFDEHNGLYFYDSNYFSNNELPPLIFLVPEVAYGNYKALNEENHFFNFIAYIGASKTEPPTFTVECGYDDYFGDRCTSCSVSVNGNGEDVTIISWAYSVNWHGVVDYYENDHYYFTAPSGSAKPKYFIVYAIAVKEGCLPSDLAMQETPGLLPATEYSSGIGGYDFEYGGVYYSYVYGTDNLQVVTPYYYEYVSDTWGYEDYITQDPIPYSGEMYISGAVEGHLVTTIGYVYGDSGLTSVFIPTSVTSICDYAFYDCPGLTSITIPASVTSIGSSAFSGCSGLNEVYSYISDPSQISLGQDVFSSQNIDSRTLYVPAGSLAAYQADTKWSQYFGSIVEMEMEPGGPIISFADDNVKARCVQIWDRNGDGEISTTEAAAVTSLNNVFRGVTSITSFDELEYFTGLSRIDKKEFYNCSGLTSITIPSSVTNIGDDAFSNCSGLTSITIPSSVTNIGSSAFFNCYGLTSIMIPEGISAIRVYTFGYCSGLTSITIPSSVTIIDSYAFYGCSGLTSITIPEGLTTIGDDAFYNCSGLTSITIPESVISIDGSAFSGCNRIEFITVNLNNSEYDSRNNCNGIIKKSTNELIVGCKNTIIPSSVTSIGDFAFYGCTGLTNIDIPNSVMTISWGAFDGCNSLTSIDIPNSVTSISNYAFYECSGLTSVVIGNSVTTIGNEAFSSCSGLTSINIPNSVTAIGFDAFDGTAWYNNQPNGLVYAGLVAYKYKGTMPEGTIITLQEGTKGIGGMAFSNCIGLTSIDIPNSVISIGDYAFAYCSGLTSVTIPNSVTSIGDYAFNDCSGLNVVYSYISDLSSISMGSSVFYRYPNNYSSRTLYVPTGTLAAYQADTKWSDYFGSIVEMEGDIISFADANVKAICIQNWDTNGNGELGVFEAAAVTDLGTVFKGNSSITSFNELQYFTGLESITSNAFYACNGLTSIIIPSSVTTIGDYAFSACSALTSIIIPNSVTSLGLDAFYNCRSLTSIDLPNTITTIDYGAFFNCYQLTSITIPNSVTSIGAYAFSGCSSLTSVTIGNSVASIGYLAFDSCSGLADITVASGNTIFDSRNNCNAIIETTSNTLIVGCKNSIIPNSVTAIGECSFWNCSDLINIDIPNSVTAIGESAFWNCNGLTNVHIPSSVTSVGENVFWGCSGLASITVESGNTYFDSRNNCNAIIETTSNTLIAGCKNTIIPNSVTTIGDYAFSDCSSLISIDIPNSINFIGDYAFSGCSGLNEVYSHIAGLSSISMGSDVFYRDPANYGNRILYVPSGTSAAYQKDTNWSQYFGSIVEMEETILVSSIELNESSEEMAVGNILQLIATVLPDNAANKSVNWTSSNPAVATVDGNGLVTAVAPGVATITVTTADGSNLSASCAVTVLEDLSNYDNYLSISDTTAFHGDTIVVPVKMFNEADVISFQTDIFLPEGLELLQEDGEYIIDPSERMTRTHSIMSDNVSNGSIRVLCYSSNYKPFTGNSGDDLFYLTLKVADDAEGDYTIQLKNTLLTNTDFVDMPAPDVAATVNVKAYILGDANNSRLVTVGDVVATAQYVLEQNPQPFIFEAADVNFDGNITVADVSRIAWMVLNPDATAPRRAPAVLNSGDRMSGEGISLMRGETRRVSIALDNALNYSAFQLDLSLPEGLTASNFQLTDRAGSHAFDVNTLGGGNIRALCYSPALTAISGHEGALLTFDVTANSAVTGAIMVDGIELVTTACESVRLDGFAIDVNSTSGVNEQIAGKTVARVDYYNLAGQQIDRPEAGVTLVVTTYTDGTRATAKIVR